MDRPRLASNLVRQSEEWNPFVCDIASIAMGIALGLAWLLDETSDYLALAAARSAIS